MTKTAAPIVPMKRTHVRACAEIAASSEPWKTLGETVDFDRYVALKQAYVCLEGSEPAGFIIFTAEPVFARGGYLRAIGVSPHMRRRGNGRKLMSFAENRTARRAPNFYLCVSSFNRQAQAFYRDLGYTRVGRIPGLLSPKTAEYIYWKNLALRPCLTIK